MKILVKNPVHYTEDGAEHTLDSGSYNYLFGGAYGYRPGNWDQTHWIFTREDGQEVHIPVATYELEILISPDVEVFQD